MVGGREVGFASIGPAGTVEAGWEKRATAGHPNTGQHENGSFTFLEREDLKPGDLLKVARVERGYRIALFNRRSANQQVIGRERDALGGLLSTELTCDFRRTVRDGVNRDMLLQLIDEGAAVFPDLRRVGPRYAVNEFCQGNR